MSVLASVHMHTNKSKQTLPKIGTGFRYPFRDKEWKKITLDPLTLSALL